MRSSTPSVEPRAAAADALLRLKREYLLPCAYHFYRNPPLIVGAEDCELIDADGRRYLDLYSGVTVVNAGHCNRAINAAVVAQMQRLDHTTSIYLTEPVVRLAERLASILPGGLRRSFCCTSGSEANEGALLLAALHTGRSEFFSLGDSLHGRTKAAMSATGLAMWRTDPWPLASFHHVACDFASGECRADDGGAAVGEIERAMRQVGAERVAALIAEPIRGNGGIVVPPRGFWPAVRELCDRYGMLLILDEVQTGRNRTGSWWACEQWGVVPDILTTAKALGNGYPISAFVTTDAIAAAYTKPGASTFGGNPVGAAAALATIEFHERHGLAARSRERGAQLRDGLERVARDSGLMRNVRGAGLMIGADVVDAEGGSAPQRLEALLEALKERGMLCGKSGADRNVLTLMPPLTVTRAQVEEFLAALKEALRASE